jgi:hypothetical protein
MFRLLQGKKITSDEIWESGIRTKRDLERAIKQSDPDISASTLSRRVRSHWIKFKAVMTARAEDDSPGVYVAYHKEEEIAFVYAVDRKSAERMFNLLLAPLLGSVSVFLDSASGLESDAAQKNARISEKHKENEILLQQEIALLTQRAEVSRFLQNVCDTLTSA